MAKNTNFFNSVCFINENFSKVTVIKLIFVTTLKKSKMEKGKSFPVALFNGVVFTTTGLYRVSDISSEKVAELVRQNSFVSAVGHDAAAQIFSNILEEDVATNRISFEQEVGQLAIALKLNVRPAEGSVLSYKEMQSIGYTFKLIERLE